MEIDAIVKLILALSVGFSLVGISFQIARFIGSLTDTVHDARKVVQNAGVLTDMGLEDYKQIRRLVTGLTQVFAGLGGLMSFMRSWQGDKGKDKSAEE